MRIGFNLPQVGLASMPTWDPPAKGMAPMILASEEQAALFKRLREEIGI